MRRFWRHILVKVFRRPRWISRYFDFATNGDLVFYELNRLTGATREQDRFTVEDAEQAAAEKKLRKLHRELKGQGVEFI